MQDMILVFCRDIRHAGLIARTLRCREVPCLPVPFDTPLEQVMHYHPRGVILTSDSLEADAPDGLDFRNNTSFKMGNVHGRVVRLQLFGANVTEEMIRGLMELNENMLLNIHYQPMELEKSLTAKIAQL